MRQIMVYMWMDYATGNCNTYASGDWKRYRSGGNRGSCSDGSAACSSGWFYSPDGNCIEEEF